MKAWDQLTDQDARFIQFDTVNGHTNVTTCDALYRPIRLTAFIRRRYRNGETCGFDVWFSGTKRANKSAHFATLPKAKKFIQSVIGITSTCK